MNCLNKSLVDVGRGIGAKHSLGMAFGLVDGGAGITKSVLEKLKIQE